MTTDQRTDRRRSTTRPIPAEELQTKGARFSDGDRLLTSAEAAALLGRSYKTLHGMMTNGNAPRSALVGGRRAYWESDVIAWIDDQFEAQGHGRPKAA